MKTFPLLKQLTAPCGPSGFERTEASQVAADLLSPLVDEVSIDRMGNVIGVRRCGLPSAPKVLLDAHLDEVGMMVTGYEEGGFLRFTQIGGIDPRILPDREVTILTQPKRFGIITAQSPWLFDDNEMLPMKELYIDTGMTDEEMKKRIPIGTAVSFREDCTKLGKHLYAGKSMDDRSCFAIILKTLELLHGETLDVDLYAVASCCEETGAQGAITATYTIHPDCAVALDVTFGTTPDAPNKGFALGSGPAIGIGPNVAWWMADRFKCKAKELHMNYSEEVMAGDTGTNGWEIQISREGVPTAILSLPERYMHTPIEVVHKRDMKDCARLLAAFLRDLGKEMPQ